MLNKSETAILINLLVNEIDDLVQLKNDGASVTSDMIKNHMHLLNKLQSHLKAICSKHDIIIFCHAGRKKLLALTSIHSLHDNNIYNTCQLLAHNNYINMAMIDIDIINFFDQWDIVSLL